MVTTVLADAEPMSSVIAAAIGLSLGGTRRVVNELLELGVIACTAPARSPKQRYRIVHMRLQ